jgi:hypothetical protein
VLNLIGVIKIFLQPINNTNLTILGDGTLKEEVIEAVKGIANIYYKGYCTGMRLKKKWKEDISSST